MLRTNALTLLAIAILLALSGCGLISAPAEAPPEEPPVRGIPLPELVARFKTLDRLEPAPPDYLTPLVVKPRQPKDTDEAFRAYQRWCTDNGGELVARATAAECPSYDTPVAGCIGEAQYWYAWTHDYAGSVMSVCLSPDKVVTSAMLHIDAPHPKGTAASDSHVAFYAGPDLIAFVTKYNDYSKARSAAEEEQRAREQQAAQAAFDRAVAELDASKEKGITALPLARDSVDFIREKILISYGETRKSVFLEGPCNFETHSKHQNPTPIDLRKLDLNALETVTETKGNKYNRDATSVDEVISVYQLLIRDGAAKGYAEFGDIDSATRAAKALSALAKRCGAKLDERFK